MSKKCALSWPLFSERQSKVEIGQLLADVMIPSLLMQIFTSDEGLPSADSLEAKRCHQSSASTMKSSLCRVNAQFHANAKF